MEKLGLLLEETVMYKVFLVEDEPAILKNIQCKIKNLELENFHICGSASSAEEAWEQLENEAPDILISDIKMPGEGGLWLFEKVRKKYQKKVICVALSAYSDFEYLQKCIRIGIDNYLLKPISIMQLRNQFDEFLKVLEKMPQNEYRKTFNQKARKSSDFICDKIDDYLEENYMKDIQLDNLSKKLNYSAQHLCAVYKKEKNVTVGEALQKIRVDRSCDIILQYPHWGLADIAEKVGYGDYRYFCRVFKKRVGQTPKEYKVHRAKMDFL